MQAPEVPVSWGELIDKITILEIKSVRLQNPAALDNVRKELGLLAERAGAVLTGDVLQLKERLATVNRALWEIEDKIREKEARQQFDAEFIALARSVYKQNDQRAAVKRQINALLASDLVEEKSYRPY
jgi:Family of unknown function (DUF6165)